MTGSYVAPCIRDEVVGFVEEISRRSDIARSRLVALVGVTCSNYYAWRRRLSTANRHNGAQPRDHWILPWERAAILAYCRSRLDQGYRRLTWQMLDQNVVAVSPSTTYRVLSQEGLLKRWAGGEGSAKGHGFKQPSKPHQHWHVDICYINVRGAQYFLISVLDGFSRAIVHHELRTRMKCYDVSLTIQRASEAYRQARPRIISDNGGQFIAKDFRVFIRSLEFAHVRTSVKYPQSNGKIERYHRTIKLEAIRRQAYLSLDDARRQIAAYVQRYNNERLHSAIYYLTPWEVLEGNMIARLREREEKLIKARRKRLETL